MRRELGQDRIAELQLAPEQGLTTAEVLTRLQRHGHNDILERPGGGWRVLVADTARDPMLWFLVITAALFAFLGDMTEALILVLAIVPLAGMDAFLHRRTQASTEGLSTRLASRARVARDGKWEEVPATELVPGDLALVATGELFPADGIVLGADAVQVDESALTGEAYPVRKQALPVLPGQGDRLLDGVHWGFAGTRVLTGEARVRITHTGGETVYGEIVRSAIGGSHARTPLQQAIANLVTVLLVTAAIICLLLAWVRWQQGFGLVDALISALTLAVAALPEEFPVVFTFFLGVGVYRLARRQALVRRAVVVENIGRVSCICSDKTGTLTDGYLTLTHLVPAHNDDTQLVTIGSLASRSDSGDPLDAAILARRGEHHEVDRVAIFPFTEERKRETSVVRKDGSLLAATKGAPEVILAMSTESPEQRQQWLDRVKEYSGSGHKVIACASRLLPEDWAGGEPDRKFILAGLLAFEDPVREGAAEAVRRCGEAGIHVIMVTGDHPDTARAIASQLGLGHDEPRVIDAEGLRLRLDSGARLRDLDVVARATPGQKLTLVRQLQREGETVAVTGDGVNDVPALQAADIGIAMGERGTRSAREVAAIVLLDDNFRTIVRAIAEGRQLFQNLRLSFAYLLMVHIPLVVSAALIPLAGYPLLYLPVHIVWLELIIHPTALLVFQELPTTDHLDRGRQRTSRFFSRRQWAIIALTGLLITVGVAVSYAKALGAGYDTEHARSVALALLILSSAAVTAGLSRMANRAAQWVVSIAVTSLAAMVQIRPLAEVLHLSPLHLDDWGIALGVSIAAGMIPTFMLGIRAKKGFVSSDDGAKGTSER